MVLCNNVSPSDAMRNFSVARGHPIERPNYISAIMQHRSNQELKQRISNVISIRRRSRWGNESENGPQQREQKASLQRSEISNGSDHDSRNNVQSVGRVARRDSSSHRVDRSVNGPQRGERSNELADYSQYTAITHGGNSTRTRGVSRSIQRESGSQWRERNNDRAKDRAHIGLKGVERNERSNNNSRWGHINPRSTASNDTNWNDWVNKRMKWEWKVLLHQHLTRNSSQNLPGS